jgi:hypothetical protein
MTATATLSRADDPWLRIGKDGLFRLSRGCRSVSVSLHPRASPGLI